MNLSMNFLQHFASGTAVQGTEGVSNNQTGTMTPYAVGEGLSDEMRRRWARTGTASFLTSSGMT